MCNLYSTVKNKTKKLLTYKISEGLAMQLPVNSLQITQLNSYIAQENNSAKIS